MTLDITKNSKGQTVVRGTQRFTELEVALAVYDLLDVSKAMFVNLLSVSFPKYDYSMIHAESQPYTDRACVDVYVTAILTKPQKETVFYENH